MSGEVGGRGRGAKRKVEQQPNAPVSKRSRGELQTPNLPSNGFPREHPFNRDGYRYVLAEADPHAPHRQVIFLPRIVVKKDAYSERSADRFHIKSGLKTFFL